ncbi:hypothetical protein [Streptomyces sp. t39]|uniref:hypothetical protein n=1 Tax=Streptomyces sp. t39 TaxID=1828156 RepID=UPI0011CE2504|nr:hypothetical protein [Streptomyces sp. t39]
MVEDLLPAAAHLVTLVHGDGGPRDVHQALASLSSSDKDVLLIVLAGLVNPDQPMSKALGWLDFNEFGEAVVPAWGASETLRDLVPEPVDVEDDYVDGVAVQRYLAGEQVAVTKSERLAAVVLAVRRGMSYLQVDRVRGLADGSTGVFITRLRAAYRKEGREFPELPQGSSGGVLSPEQVVEIRERSAAGAKDLELALAFGVQAATISAVCTGRRYAECGGPIRVKRENRPDRASRTVWGTSTPGFLGDGDAKELAA